MKRNWFGSLSGNYTKQDKSVASNVRGPRHIRKFPILGWGFLFLTFSYNYFKMHSLFLMDILKETGYLFFVLWILRDKTTLNGLTNLYNRFSVVSVIDYLVCSLSLHFVRK